MIQLVVVHPFYAHAFEDGVPRVRHDECVQPGYLDALHRTLRYADKTVLLEELGFGERSCGYIQKVAGNKPELIATWLNTPRPVEGWRRLESALTKEAPVLLVGGQFNKSRSRAGEQFDDLSSGCVSLAKTRLEMNGYVAVVLDDATFSRCYGENCRFAGEGNGTVRRL